MRLKLDENLGKAAARVLQSAGYDVRTVFEQGLSSAGDRDVIAACQTERRCLVTLDLEFSNPLVFDPAEYAGIAVLRLPGRPSHQDIVEACQSLAARSVFAKPRAAREGEREHSMKTSDDSEVDALSITFRETTVTTKPLGEGIAAEHDSEGRLAGLEILDAVRRFGREDTLRHVTLEGLGPPPVSDPA